MNISYSEKSDESNVSDSIVNALWYWIQSDENYLLFTRYSGYILQERWIHLMFLLDSVYQKLLKLVYFLLSVIAFFETRHRIITLCTTFYSEAHNYFLNSMWLSGMRCRLAYSPADATATHYLLLQ